MVPAQTNLAVGLPVSAPQSLSSLKPGLNLPSPVPSASAVPSFGRRPRLARFRWLDIVFSEFQSTSHIARSHSGLIPDNVVFGSAPMQSVDARHDCSDQSAILRLQSRPHEAGFVEGQQVCARGAGKLRGVTQRGKVLYQPTILKPARPIEALQVNEHKFRVAG